jgi:hypothetical protein
MRTYEMGCRDGIRSELQRRPRIGISEGQPPTHNTAHRYDALPLSVCAMNHLSANMSNTVPQIYSHSTEIVAFTNVQK